MTDKNREIEEMAKTLCGEKENDCRKCYSCGGICEFWMESSVLYNAGYRKQSEDAVEVVRCRDCVYFKQSVSALFPHASAFVCDCPYGLQKNVNENDFCCHGARMKGDEGK